VSGNQAWKVLIVDDEPEIHILTCTVLKEVQFEDLPLLFLSAYDGPGNRKILEEESDIFFAATAANRSKQMKCRCLKFFSAM
jgi:hypothetical protein